tara:strand:+ start:1258 stop:1944 length:687 start_codon:yes stop_codon:yes gene_type:complete
MAFSDFTSDLGVDLGGSAGTFSTIIIGILTFTIVAIFVAVITYLLANRKSFNITIHIFEDIGGNTSPIGIDKAKEIVLPFTSVKAFYLRNNKIFLPRPSIQTGKRVYWYFKRKDGEWVNCGPQFNEKTSKIDLTFDHSDMRMANASLKKLVEKNYKKLNWLKEYAPYIGFAILIMMLGITFFLVIGEASKVTGGVAEATTQIAQSIEAQKEILQSLDNLMSTSGVRQG